MKVEWEDLGREPKCAPDPDYPAGKDIQLDLSVAHKCIAKLPYPAKRCGYYVVTCDKCKLRVAVTTAGRADDPRSVELPCRELMN
jgi:hypothetical protein